MIRCQHCAQTFSDMKGLQIHNFLEHHRQEPEPRGPALLAAPAPAPARTPPAVINLSQLRHASPAPASPVSCHICGLKLPNQAVFQQVRSLDMKCSPKYLVCNGLSCQHLQTHAMFRPYICSLCDAGFTSLAQLESHSALHA